MPISIKNMFPAINRFIEKNGEYYDRIPLNIFSSLLIAGSIRILTLLEVSYHIDVWLIFIVSFFILFGISIIISRGISHIKKLEIANAKQEKTNDDLHKLIGVKFEYLSNAVKKDSSGNDYYDPTAMYVKLQGYINNAKSLKLLDNVYSNLDEIEPENNSSTPKNQERKKWLSLIKKKLETEKDFVYQRIFLQFDPKLKANLSKRNEKSKLIFNFVKGDTLNHINELASLTRSNPTQCSLKFLAYERAMETFIIVDDKYLIFQVDGIDIEQNMPQDLLVMNNIAGSIDIIKTYEGRFAKLSELAISIETVETYSSKV